MKKIFIFAFLFVFSALACAVNTSAYLDASATAYIIQIISGILITVGAIVAITWKKIKLFFKKRRQDARMTELSKMDEAQRGQGEEADAKDQ